MINFSGLPEQYKRLSASMAISIEQVLQDCCYICGAQVDTLEEQLAARTGSSFCLCCANGTDALTLAIMAWGAGHGDAVFVPAFTFAATAEAVALRGATPVFVDVNETFNIDPASLEHAISTIRQEGWLRPVGILAVNLFGVPADYRRLNHIAAREGLWLLEDAAQSFGASRFGRASCTFGEISATSFFPVKPLGCYGDGGAIFTDSRPHAETIHSLRLHGKGSSKYDHRIIGINSRLDTLQAAVLLQKLSIFDDELAARNENAKKYTAALSRFGIAPVIPADTVSAWSQYTLRLPDRVTRDRLKLELSTCGIPSMVYYPAPLHLQAAFAYLGGRKGMLPVSEATCEQVLSIPVHAYLGQEDLALIISTITEFMIKKT